MVATDMVSAKGWDANRAMVLLKSTDLVNWSSTVINIQKKYPNNDKNITYLVNKIIKGGSGVWGTMPMSAHSSLKKEDAKSMAQYILGLKK